VLRHLEYDTPDWVERRVNEGVDVAIDYFFGPWLKEPLPGFATADKHDLDRREYLHWFDAFSVGLLLAMLAGRWDDVARLCGWVEVDMTPDWVNDELQPAGAQVYITIASGLRPEPMSGIAELEANIARSRTKRPRLLLAAWQAARAGDQRAFNDAIGKCLKHFDKWYVANINEPRAIPDWIAQHESVICLAARRLGIQVPELPERLAAMLISRESLGFDVKG
jgi:hypothetical protein